MWREWMDRIIHLAGKKKIDYIDIRLVPGHREEMIFVKNGEVRELGSSERSGIGVRVLQDGVWGFASSSRLEAGEMDNLLERALSLAKTARKVQRHPVRLSPAPTISDGFYRTPVIRDPFAEVSLEDKIRTLLKLDTLMKEASGRITVRESNMSFSKMHQFFMNSEGSYIEQEIVESGGGIEAVAVMEGEVQRRSYPNSFRGNIGRAGYEFIESLHLEAHAGRIAREADALLFSDPCPEGVTNLILMPDQLCLQIHESVGHAVELDRIFGTELTYAGGSFLSGRLNEFGTLRYGSPLVNIVADATLQEGLGTFGYDDEGVPASKTSIIKDGIWTGVLASRETASQFREAAGKKIDPGGCMRGSHSNRAPLIRMTNLCLEPGTGSLDDLIADTKEGILLETNVSWSIDDLRKNFSFGTEIGWEIRDGRRGKMLKNPMYTGMTLDFWNSCNAVCDRSEWKYFGTPNCGKGMPGQVMHVGHGASPARFSKVRVGNRKV